ncbi:unnamed protein product [Ectocarpus sp. 6 AP-2014]
MNAMWSLRLLCSPRTVVLLLLALLMASVGEIDRVAAATDPGTVPEVPAPSTASARQPLGLLSELSPNTDRRATPRHSSAAKKLRLTPQDASRSRMKKVLDHNVSVFVNSLQDACAAWTERLNKNFEPVAVEDATVDALLANKDLTAFMEDLASSSRKHKERGNEAIRDSIRALWKRLSSSETVASSEGWQFRRVLLGALCGPNTTYKEVHEFVGGSLSHRAFNEAQIRRDATDTTSILHDLISDRKLRSDRLEVSCPKALAWIVERIIFHTQPSPCLVKTEHDYDTGNHRRSEADNSLVCVYPARCKTESVRYLMGTKLQLYQTVMKDLDQAFAAEKVEVPSISRPSFDKIIPFYVVEQSLRSCICVHCYKAKLVTKGLCDLWPNLHQGSTPGSKCDCECELCKDGGCAEYLPYGSSKAVHSMADFSDMLMCPKEQLYCSEDGTLVDAHKAVCVSGHCLLCKQKQERFFDCPKNKGNADRQLNPAAGPAQVGAPPPGEVRWKNFTTVDDNGQATSAPLQRRRAPNSTAGGEDDEDFDPLGGSKRRTRRAVAEKTGTVDEFMAELKDHRASFGKHRRSYKTQRAAFTEKKLTIEEGEVLCIVDFQERLQVGEQDEVQSQHWDREATTIFPCPIFFKVDGRVWAYSFQILSDDMAQDNAWVQFVMSKLLNEDIPALLRKIGAKPMTRCTIWTDNCAKQFKCRFHFGWVADAQIMGLDKDGEPTGIRVHMEHHYFGACHGKNVSDAEGGMTKEYVRRMILNMMWRVASSRDLCEKLEKALNFFLRFANGEETEAFWKDRNGREGGTEQLLVTKTWIGEDSDQTQETTFLLTKNPNTMMGRRYIFIGASDVSSDVRKAARSSAKEIEVSGCQTISMTAATDTPGVLMTNQFSCYCAVCRDSKPENCPLIRKGIMSGPQEFSRRANRNTDIVSAKEDDLEELSEWMPSQLPFGSIALLRVDPSEHDGQDIVPVVVARKAACPWTPRVAVDGMFGHGDTIVWVVDLPQAIVRGKEVEYLVPRSISGVKFRAVPLACIAGLGQGVLGYMEHPQCSQSSLSSETFVLREGVVENARSTVVLLSRNPLAAFESFQPVPLSVEDEARAPVEPRMFVNGTVIEQLFKGPRNSNGRPIWKHGKKLRAIVIACQTDLKSRRHQYKLQWSGELMILVLAEVEEFVDEGHVEQYRTGDVEVVPTTAV